MTNDEEKEEIYKALEKIALTKCGGHTNGNGSMYWNLS